MPQQRVLSGGCRGVPAALRLWPPDPRRSLALLPGTLLPDGRDAGAGARARAL